MVDGSKRKKKGWEGGRGTEYIRGMWEKVAAGLGGETGGVNAVVEGAGGGVIDQADVPKIYRPGHDLFDAFKCLLYRRA